MRTATKRMAVCAMLAALCVVLMLLGAILELGMYAAPMFAGLCFIPVGQKYGRKYQTMLFAVTSVLCLLLVPNVEENLMLVGFFGWYPILRPALEKLPKLLGVFLKLVIFNAAVIAIEWLVMAVLAPEVMETGLLLVLLALGNLTFWLYDFLIPRLSKLTARLTKLL